MNTDHTHITVILDRSGSMQSIRADVIGGFNAFVEGQRQVPGTATLTLVQFDGQDPYEVIHRGVPLADLRPLGPSTYIPRGNTPLLDAMGRGIEDLAMTVSVMPESVRPGRVLVVVITDGAENASRTYTKARVRDLIHQRRADGWEFVFLSADLDAIAEAHGLGIDRDVRLAYAPSAQGVSEGFSALHQSIREYRTHRRARPSFDPSQRKRADDPDRK